MAELILGPMLRYLDETQRDRSGSRPTGPARSRCWAARERTFCVEGHHYAIVPITGLEPGETYPYEVRLDGERALARWRARSSRRARSGTIHPERPLKIVFGSCRVAVPHEEPWNLSRDEDERGREVDALYALALRMIGDRPRPSGRTCCCSVGRPGLRGRGLRPTRASSSAPGATRACRPARRSPTSRSTRASTGSRGATDGDPVAVLDGRRRDDLRRPRRPRRLEHVDRSGWRRCAPSRGGRSGSRAALSSYWVYQHLGNLSPEALAELRAAAAGEGRRATPGALLRRLRAESADHGSEGSRWSFCRDLGRVRHRACSTRARAACSASGRARSSTTRNGSGSTSTPQGGFDHYMLRRHAAVPAGARAAPRRGMERGGVRGRVGGAGWSGIGERIRRALDLEHWAAFNESFRRMVRPARRDRVRPARAAAGDDHRDRRRRAPRLPGGGRAIPRERGRAERRLPGGLLAVSQRAQRARARGRPERVAARDRARSLRPLARAAGVPDPRDLAGGWRRRRPSTTSSRRSSSTGAAPCSGSSAPCRDEADNRSIETSLERRLA